MNGTQQVLQVIKRGLGFGMYRAWFNTINEAYVKACYSQHYEISEEALRWLGNRTAILHELVEAICREHLAKLKDAVGS
ncbi:hypothetical protein BLM14_22175 (plasmid) [Phyllobacterium zundukense]|nr:hypothetical protein BLM14_22175 [Phyllobacterium zundukense]